MAKDIQVGVVGCGYWGPNLVRNFKSLPGCRLKMMCDSNRERLEHFQPMYPEVLLETNYEHILNGVGVDAVAIATKVKFHYPMAKASLLAGKHTFIEKPMAGSSEHCEELVEIAKKKGVILMAGHTFLYSPAVQELQKIIESKEIGSVTSIVSQRLKGLFQNDVNAAWDLGPHDISIILSIMGEMPSAVSCKGRANVVPGIEDETVMTLKFSTSSAVIHNKWNNDEKVRQMIIKGDDGMQIAYDDVIEQKLQILDTHDGRLLRIPEIGKEEPLRNECQHFLHCIKHGETPLSCGQKGLDLVRILEAASESIRTGTEVALFAAPELLPTHTKVESVGCDVFVPAYA